MGKFGLHYYKYLGFCEWETFYSVDTNSLHFQWRVEQFTSDTICDGLAVLIDENSGSRFRLVRFAEDVDVLLRSSFPTMLNSAIQ